MKKTKKVILAGAAAILAGFGIYKIRETQRDNEIQTGDAWTAADMPDLSGKVVIVTGANSGIGYEAAKAFAHKGARTILASRSVEKAQAALDQIKAEIPDAAAEIMILDLASLDSIHKFADRFKAKYDRLDVLLNNAGIMMVPYGLTEDGFERQFGTNHLGHFALTGLLVDLLLDTKGSRVVNVSSNGHKRGELDFENLQYEGGQGYTPMDAYARSKLANLHFTYELQRWFESTGADTIATAAHPGLTNTNLADHMTVVKLLRPLLGSALQDAAMGALPSLRAAVDAAAQGGDYYGPGGDGERRGYPVKVSSSQAAQDQEDARKLWEVSEELTGVQYL